MSCSFSGILWLATLGSLLSKDPWLSFCADSDSSVVISSHPWFLSAVCKELLLLSSAWSRQSVAQPLSISDISRRVGYLHSRVDLPPLRVLLHSPPPLPLLLIHFVLRGLENKAFGK